MGLSQLYQLRGRVGRSNRIAYAYLMSALPHPAGGSTYHTLRIPYARAVPRRAGCRPVQTYVMENNPEFVREAIHREIARGGQVYYLYNRVESIGEGAPPVP